VVSCTISGNPNRLTSGTANAFGPTNVNMTNGSGGNLAAVLQSTVNSPDGSMTSISGNSTGFSGTVQNMPAKIDATYKVTTSANTKSGTYTGTTTYTWSTI
jgi:hypothetical protein